MSKVVRISNELFSRLESHAVGFDSPTNVIEKLLNSFEGTSSKETNLSPKKDFTRYSFNGESYGKGKLVLAVVKEYVNTHENLTFKQLSKTFPKSLQGSIGVVNKLEDVNKKYAEKSSNRHYTREEQILKLADSSVVVCTEWGAGLNFENFLVLAEKMGISILEE